MSAILGQMRVFPSALMRNLESTTASSTRDSLLQDLVKKACPGIDAYKAVQENAMSAWESEDKFP